MSAVELAAAVRARTLSPVEIVDAVLARIESVDPHLNSYCTVTADAAREAARAAEAQVMAGAELGPLHGVPVSIKDLVFTRGVRTTRGSLVFRDFVPNEDAPVVERLVGAGAIVIGKTNTPEFGLGSHTYNPVYGATRNAYNLTRSAGGSSGGAAVALALRMVPLTDGSDYGGSLRNPAGWNSVFGFRASIGRIPTDARDCWLPSMSVVGPMARTVTDLALLLSVQAGFDARLPLSQEGDGSVFQRRLECSLSGKRIAWGRDFGGRAPGGARQ